MSRPARRLCSSLCLLALTLLVLLPLSSRLSSADHAMPTVLGQTEAEALRALEALGLNVRIVTIAGGEPGRVAVQEPIEGVRVEAGDDAVLLVGVLVRIETVAPRVVGMAEASLVSALESAYVLDIKYVPGPRSMEGRAIDQKPQPGASIDLRARFRVKIVRNAAVVPVLIGRSEEAARVLLEQAGLAVHVRYVGNAGTRPGTVISQDPRSGAEILPGAVVALRVAGRRPTEAPPSHRVRVPDLVGLVMQEAIEELLARGLIPHIHLQAGHGKQDWTVLGQESAPNSVVKEGASVGLEVAKPADMSGGFRAPSLYGMRVEAARELLRHLGLRVAISEKESALPVGTVFKQSAMAGERIRRGRPILITVAKVPPPGWRPPVVRVPDLTGHTGFRAYVALITHGLLARLRRDHGPGKTADQVFRQDPTAGTAVPAGSRITYYLPYRATVPELRGKTRTQALEALHDAGLEGLARRSGPDLLGLSQVVTQTEPPGKVIARGSLVPFRYRKLPPAKVPVRVPNVVGMSQEDARKALEDADFIAVLRAAAFGQGKTEVISQSPAAGVFRPHGHTIVATYRYLGGAPLPRYVRVPRVIGATMEGAKSQLEALGFNVRTVRRGSYFRGTTEVIGQNPLAGSSNLRGSSVVITYQSRPITGALIPVPNVVGMSNVRAFNLLRGQGFTPMAVTSGARVSIQLPAAGSMVKPGTVVKLRLKN